MTNYESSNNHSDPTKLARVLNTQSSPDAQGKEKTIKLRIEVLISLNKP